jgi:hypothetical protein
MNVRQLPFRIRTKIARIRNVEDSISQCPCSSMNKEGTEQRAHKRTCLAIKIGQMSCIVPHSVKMCKTITPSEICLIIPQKVRIFTIQIEKAGGIIRTYYICITVFIINAAYRYLTNILFKASRFRNTNKRLDFFNLSPRNKDDF